MLGFSKIDTIYPKRSCCAAVAVQSTKKCKYNISVKVQVLKKNQQTDIQHTLCQKY